MTTPGLQRALTHQLEPFKWYDDPPSKGSADAGGILSTIMVQNKEVFSSVL